MTKTDKDFLFKLLETPSPTGFEMPAQKLWSREAEKYADRVDCDAYGSTWAILEGKSPRKLMLAAHADEIGFMIKHVSAEGFLFLERIGGSDSAIARSRRLRLFGDRGEVLGVVGNTAIHLRPRENEKAPKVHELWVDVGASSAKEVQDMGLRIGHSAVYQDGPAEMAKGRIISRALDNRIGSYILCQVLKKLSKDKKTPFYSLICLNTVQEEVGGNGAQMATHRLHPDLALCFDVTHATDTPGIDHSQYGKVTLGGGPSLSHGTANHPLAVQRLMDTATARKIPFQHEAVSRYTGTDTDTIFTTRDGIPSALVSLPLRSMHSTVETADLKDIQACVDLITAFVLSLKETDTFHHQL